MNKYIHVDDLEFVKSRVALSFQIKEYGQFYFRKDANSSTDLLREITITDNAIGFEEEYADQIFLPSQRLNSKREFEGTGIGLDICKKIVENHHGSISVKSKVNEGSTLSILLPLKQ